MDLIAMLVGVVSGGGTYKLADLLVLKNRRQKIDVAAEMRDELRAEVKELKGRVADLQAAVDGVEKQRDQVRMDLERYRLNVYRLLMDCGVERDILDKVLQL